jgi:hypothetical protein
MVVRPRSAALAVILGSLLGCGGGEPTTDAAARADVGPRRDAGALDAAVEIPDGAAMDGVTEAGALDAASDAPSVPDAFAMDAGPPDAVIPPPPDANLDAPLPSSVSLVANCVDSLTLQQGCDAYCGAPAMLSEPESGAGAILWARFEDASRSPARICLYAPGGLAVDLPEVTSACSRTASMGVCILSATCTCAP